MPGLKEGHMEDPYIGAENEGKTEVAMGNKVLKEPTSNWEKGNREVEEEKDMTGAP